MKTEGKIVDVLDEKIFSAELKIKGKYIKEIKRKDDVRDQYIIPGLIDSHIHIESSMLPPSRFARIAVQHGTVAVVSDPHEIANVLGVEGIKYMTENSKRVPLKFYFGAPSCVPSTSFETNGAKIGPKKIDELFSNYDCKYLGEVMNYPAVINKDEDVMGKIEIAKKYNSVIDGHAPGLSGKDLEKYISAGITTDHESITLKEAEEKIEKGMKIQIRDGSLSKKLDEFHPILKEYPNECMFCSDDKHPDDLIDGHINVAIKKALKHNISLMDCLKAASVNPILHYDLDVGLIQEGDKADFIIIDDIENFEIKDVFIDGNIVYKEGEVKFSRSRMDNIVNNFKTKKKYKSDFKVKPKNKNIHVISINNEELTTEEIITTPKVEDDNVISDVDRDILKIAVVNRYFDQNPSLGFVKGFGIEDGAIASSISHDSHNLISVGTNDEYIWESINTIIENRGGLSVVSNEREFCLPLPIGGLMSNKKPCDVADNYKRIKNLSRKLGCKLRSPFMTLSFLTLLVIPELKISDKGLFDVNKFEFIEIFE